ncbi:MAG TPA: 3-oxoadipate enol-lactonase [Steroidobacteraceae bacterium]|nr:3-oxoadipate enol-lactonase [Steroidobacteraceae bacterium]
MKTTTNGIQLNYTIDGAGPWLVMSHSLACNLEMWDPQMDALKRAYQVLRFDTRGHGGSDAPAGAYSLEQLADDLHGLLQALKVERPHFVGLSMGGMIGMTYALKYPGRLRSLVLCDTSSRLGPEVQPIWDDRIKTASEKGMEPLVEPTLKRWFTEAMVSRRPPVLDKVAAMIRATPPAGYAGCCHAIPKINVTARLQEITCPIQVIVGEQDAGTPVAMSREIQAAAPGSELAVIPNASHLSNLEQPEAFNRALLDFLARAG